MLAIESILVFEISSSFPDSVNLISLELPIQTPLCNLYLFLNYIEPNIEFKPFFVPEIDGTVAVALGSSPSFKSFITASALAWPLTCQIILKVRNQKRYVQCYLGS